MRNKKVFLIIYLLVIGFFLSSIQPSKVFAIPNPSAVYCDEKGYDYETRTSSDGGQYGVCNFPDGSECDAWDYYCKCTENTGSCSAGMISEGKEECSYPCDCDPVDGGWSEWSECGADCTMRRTCTNPTPSCQGDPCEGSSSRPCTGGKCIICGDSVCSDAENADECPEDCEIAYIEEERPEPNESDDENESSGEQEKRPESDESDDENESSGEQEKRPESDESDYGDTENDSLITDLSDIPWWVWFVLGFVTLTIFISALVYFLKVKSGVGGS